MSYNIIAFSGSFRKGSFNTTLVRAFQERAPEGVTIELVDFSDIPLYNQDLEASFPEVVANLKEKIKKADGIMVATPEYNRTIPGVLSNMIDWTSRPWQQGAWDGKPVFIMGATGGNVGTALAQADLKKMMLFMNAHVIGQPEFYMTGAMQKIDENGVLTDEQTKEHIDGAIKAFTAYIDTFKK